MSEYMIDRGGPVVAGKKKDLVGMPVVVVESITRPLLADKLKYQDLPMLAILVVHFLATMGSVESAGQTASLAYIGITLMSLASGYASYRWPREAKQVDLKSVVKAIQDRLQEAERRREDAKEAQADGKTPAGLPNDRSGLSAAHADGSEDTDRSEADSSGLNDVIQELEQLGKDKSVNGLPRLEDTQKIPLLDAANGVDQLAPASPRASDPGAALVPLPDPQGDKAADQGAADAPTASPAVGVEQDANAKPGTAAAPGAPGATNEEGTRPAGDKANQIDLDTAISKQDVRQ